MSRTISDIDKIIDNYKAYMQLERGMAENTVTSGTDLDFFLISKNLFHTLPTPPPCSAV